MKAGLRTLDLNLLKTLDALLDERSVTRAAARLALTQPAVSGKLNHLRDYFDDPLFIRTHHPDAGKQLSLDRFCPLEHVLVSYEGESFHGVTDDGLVKTGRRCLCVTRRFR